MSAERNWRVEDGIIRFVVTSRGMTGGEWIKRFEDKGFFIGRHVEHVLCSSDFKPTSGVTTEVAVFKSDFWYDSDLVTSKIRDKVLDLGFSTPDLEVACLICEAFSQEEIEAMGLWWIIIMHEPVRDSDGALILLNASFDNSGRQLGTRLWQPYLRWDRICSFAFTC